MASFKTIKAGLLVFAGGASYGVLSTFVKLGYAEGFTTKEITGSQVFLGCLGLWLFSLILEAGRLKEVGKRKAIRLMLGGSFTGLTGIFYYLALQSVSASLGVLLLFQFTWMGFLLDWIVYRRKPAYREWGALGLILLGTILAVGMDGEIFAGATTWGIILGLLAALCYTMFLFFSGKIAAEAPALIRSTWMITGAAVITLTIFPPEFLWSGALAEGLWLWGGLVALFGMVLPGYLFAKGAPQLNMSAVTILSSVELPVVLLCAGWILREPVHVWQWAGVLLILGGIAWSAAGSDR